MIDSKIQTDENKKHPRQEKREKLRQLSLQAKDFKRKMVKQAETPGEALRWSTRTINWILLHHIYNVDGATEFKTFWDWKKEGCTIKKGEKAFVIWGQPIHSRDNEGEQNEQEDQEDKDAYEFFPLCYLFSNKQVVSLQERQEKAKEWEQKSKEVPATIIPEKIKISDDELLAVF